MKDFALVLPRTLEEAIGALPARDALAERQRVKLLAGGQDLLGELKDRLLEPEALVNLKGIPGLDAIERVPEGVRLGALVRLETLERDPFVRAALPLVAEAAAAVGSPQIRSVATLGGNLCQRPRCPYYRNEHALCLKKGGRVCFAREGVNRHNAILGGGPSWIVHPSDLAPALVACGARVTLVGPAGARTLALEDFYVLPRDGDPTRETVLRSDEVLTGVLVPAAFVDGGWRATYAKVRERDAFDFALVALALALSFEDEARTRIAEARLVLGGVAPRPWRALAAERLLAGRAPDEASARAAAEEALRGAEPLEHNAYKIPMAKGLIARTLAQLAGR